MSCNQHAKWPDDEHTHLTLPCALLAYWLLATDADHDVVVIRAFSVPVSGQDSWCTVAPVLLIYLRNGHDKWVRANAKRPEPLPIVRPPHADASRGRGDSRSRADSSSRAGSSSRGDSRGRLLHQAAPRARASSEASRVSGSGSQPTAEPRRSRSAKLEERASSSSDNGRALHASQRHRGVAGAEPHANNQLSRFGAEAKTQDRAQAQAAAAEAPDLVPTFRVRGEHVSSRPGSSHEREAGSGGSRSRTEPAAQPSHAREPSQQRYAVQTVMALQLYQGMTVVYSLHCMHVQMGELGLCYLVCVVTRNHCCGYAAPPASKTVPTLSHCAGVRAGAV